MEKGKIVFKDFRMDNFIDIILININIFIISFLNFKMLNIKRRSFLKSLAIAPVSFLSSPDISGETISKQSLFINIPAYSLKLVNHTNEKGFGTYSFDIGVGKGKYGRRQTPISNGFIYEKRKEALFRYKFSDPYRNIKEGEKIQFTNTFDDFGNPIRYKVPYENVRSIGMKIKDTKHNRYFLDFAIHTTLDEFTIGLPSSDGCIRLNGDDMLTLFSLIAPEIDDGKLKEEIPLKISYNPLEILNSFVYLHADVYKTNFDYLSEFKKNLRILKISEHIFNYKIIEDCFLRDISQFEFTYKEILRRLSLIYPMNFVSNQLKSNLHKKYNLESFLF